MALINFDCPECGHNLEVDEGGAGFIIKCPECESPLQIPDLPKSRRLVKTLLVLTTLLLLVVLGAAAAYFHQQAERLQTQYTEQEHMSRELLQNAQAAIMHQEREAQRWQQAADDARYAADTALADAALLAIEQAEAIAKELEESNRLLLDASEPARVKLLREHMKQRVDAARNTLPASPVITDVAPERGIQGQQIVFPVLPAPDGSALLENAEITSVQHDKISVLHHGGVASYHISALHPGVAAVLRIDPLTVLPKKQWRAEIKRIQHTQNQRRAEQLAESRQQIEDLLPAGP